MRSSAVASLKGSPALLGIAAFIGLSPVTARAGSAQLHSVDPVQGVATVERRSDSGATAGAATVLKTSTSSAGPNATAGIQPVATAIVQPTPAKGAVARQSSASSTEAAFDNLELTPAQRRVYRRAASAFHLFCQHWESLLHEREVNNLGHLSWRNDGGLETAMYTGYGKVESCECRASKEGLPIGKIRYEERNYSIAGKTIDEARRAAPKLIHEISTLEIFSWDKGKWFY